MLSVTSEQRKTGSFSSCVPVAVVAMQFLVATKLCSSFFGHKVRPALCLTSRHYRSISPVFGHNPQLDSKVSEPGKALPATNTLRQLCVSILDLLLVDFPIKLDSQLPLQCLKDSYRTQGHRFADINPIHQAPSNLYGYVQLLTKAYLHVSFILRLSTLLVFIELLALTRHLMVWTQMICKMETQFRP